MDSRILEVALDMVVKMYKLNDDYVTKTCNIKANSVEVEMTNGLVDLKVKMPRSIIEDRINLVMDDGEDE